MNDILKFKKNSSDLKQKLLYMKLAIYPCMTESNMPTVAQMEFKYTDKLQSFRWTLKNS